MSHNDQEAKRLLRFVGGFTREPSLQSADVVGDPQLQLLKGYIFQILEREHAPMAILDYGCGSGPLLKALYESGTLSRRHRYIGVDVRFPSEAQALAVQLGMFNDEPQPEFLPRSLLFVRESDRFSPLIKLIVLRNVLHEIPAQELSSTFYRLLRFASPGTRILIQDMAMLPEGEVDAITWDSEDIPRLFPQPAYSVYEYKDQSRSGTPWFTASVEIRQASDSAATWDKRCREVMFHKLQKIRTALEIYNQASPNERTALVYIHLTQSYTALDLQLNKTPLPNLGPDITAQGISCGPVQFKVAVLEGTGDKTLDLRCETLPGAYSLPAELHNAKSDIIARVSEQSARLGAVLFDGLHYGLVDFHTEVVNKTTEDRRLILRLRPTTYFDHLASNIIVDQPRHWLV